MAMNSSRTPLPRMCLAPAFAAAGVGALMLGGPVMHPVKAGDKPVEPAKSWDRQAAARYLDDREIYWQGWDHAQKDHGTLCVSCHTQATYGLARPTLRGPLGETGPSPAEQVMLASIEKRVRMWKQMAPFYSDAHP